MATESHLVVLDSVVVDRHGPLVARPTWTRLSALVAIVVLQALASWYEAVLITVAAAVFLLWLGLDAIRELLHGRVPLEVGVGRRRAAPAGQRVGAGALARRRERGQPRS